MNEKTSKKRASAPLTPEGVCLIIKECKDAGVSSLTWGDLTVHFGAFVQPIREPEAAPPATAEQIAKVAKSTLDEDEQALREMQLEILKLEAPEEYENLVALGDLYDDPKAGVGELDGDEEADVRGAEPAVSRG